MRTEGGIENWIVVIVVLFSLSVAACSDSSDNKNGEEDSGVNGTDDDDTDDDDTDDTDTEDTDTGSIEHDCTVVTLGEFEPWVAVSPTQTIYAPFQPAPSSSGDDVVGIEFVFRGSPLTPGEFDLSLPGDDNYSTCEHCILLVEGYDPFAPTETWFFQESGTMDLESINNPVDGQFRGTLTNVKLVEVTMDYGTYVSTPVEGGDCYFIESADFDTTN